MKVYIRIQPFFGTDGQSASSLLSTLSSWGSNHRLRGLCYLALRFKWNQDAFTGIPKVQAKIKGKKVVTLHLIYQNKLHHFLQIQLFVFRLFKK